MNKHISFLTLILVFHFMFHSLASANSEPVFTEVSAEAGILFQEEINPMAGGIAWIDIDNDGNQDLYIPNGSGPNRLYKNNGNGTFTEIGEISGTQLESENSLGVAIGDYNGDQLDDIFVTNDGLNSLLKNNGDGTFTNVTTAAQLGDANKKSYAASFGDVDEDGDLDLYVGHWDFQTVPVLHCPDNDLYLNNGDGTFSNVSVESGANNEGCAFTVPMTDYDQDGDLDLFLPNDNVAWGSLTPTLDNEMLRNEGLNVNGIPVFSKVGDLIGVGQSLTGMGAAIGDIDNDGDIDFYRTQIGAGVLSVNNGDNTFSTVMDNDAGIGWGTAFFDANNDGYIDLYRANSGSGFHGNGEANSFYLNDGGGAFRRVLDGAGLLSIEAGLGLAYADYDNDGDIDVVTHGRNGVVNLFRNDSGQQNWLKIKLKGNALNHRGIGARVFLVSTNGNETLNQMREIHAGSSHGSNHAPVIHFGLSTHDTINSALVLWPGGCTQKIRDSAINQEIVVNENNCSFTHTISGLIATESGEPVPGVSVQVNDNLGFTSTVYTDENGVYSQMVTNGLYIAYPSSEDFNFMTPDGSAIFVNINGDDETKNYIATPKMFTISGTILTPEREPVTGVPVQVNNNLGFVSTVYTDETGRYSQQVTNGLYIANPVSSDYRIVTEDGSAIFVMVDGADEAKNFIATPRTFAISGTITTATGSPLEGIPVQIISNVGFFATVYTDENGFYTQLVPNGLYVANPVSTEFMTVTEDGSAIFVTVDGANETKNFIASPRKFTISGTITTGTGEPLEGIPVQVNDNVGFVSTVFTDENGVYTQRVPNGLYIANPVSTDYRIVTADGSAIFVTVDGKNEIKNFLATLK